MNSTPKRSSFSYSTLSAVLAAVLLVLYPLSYGPILKYRSGGDAIVFACTPMRTVRIFEDGRALPGAQPKEDALLCTIYYPLHCLMMQSLLVKMMMLQWASFWGIRALDA